MLSPSFILKWSRIFTSPISVWMAPSLSINPPLDMHPPVLPGGSPFRRISSAVSHASRSISLSFALSTHFWSKYWRTHMHRNAHAPEREESNAISLACATLLTSPLVLFNYELFNHNNFNIHYWSWNYRGCWHQTCPPIAFSGTVISGSSPKAYPVGRIGYLSSLPLSSSSG